MTFLKKFSSFFSRLSWIKWVFVGLFGALLIALPFFPIPQVNL